MFKRIIKNIIALAAGQGIQLLSQIILPPVFLLAYGASGYGEWLVLSAAIGYLTTLDFGVQTYILNELTILFNRGEFERFREIQSTGLRVTLSIVVVASIAALIVFFFPLKALLKLTLTDTEVSVVVYLLALQILWSIVFGSINGLFRIIGKAHRGAMWSNMQRLLWLGVTFVLVVTVSNFWIIALGQVLTVLLGLSGVLFDLKRNAPEIFPTVKLWSFPTAKRILGQSVFFGLLLLNNYLMFQIPLLILALYVSTTVVAIFAIGRTLFMLVRQVMSILQHSIDPEITIQYGMQEQQKMQQLYSVNRALMYFGGFVLGGLVLIFHNVVLQLWLGSSITLDFHFAVVLMLVVVFAVSRDVDFHYQYATNNHIKLGIISTVTYLMMCLGDILLVPTFGILGAGISWLLAEFILTFVLNRMSKVVLLTPPALKPTILYAVLNIGFATFIWFAGVDILPRSIEDFVLIGYGAAIVVVLVAVGSIAFDAKNTFKFILLRLRAVL